MTDPKTTWQERLADGLVIPAVPLTLDESGSWSERHQRAVVNYYVEAGAGGIAVGVHSTQFAIREPKHGLFEPILRLSAQVAQQNAGAEFVRIAGICGDTQQARKEATLAADIGYHCGLLSLTAFCDQPEEVALQHAQVISEIIPIMGFYLQPAVGGRVFSFDFWKSFCEIENVVAIKIAPFNRYYTWDVVRAVMESGREDISLYTGNDDNIIADLLTPFSWQGQTRYMSGGLLGQWGVWTKRAVELLEEIKQARTSESIASTWLTRNAALTDANAAVFDTANNFAGCIPGILEVLRRQGIAPSSRCLDPAETLSLGQSEELDRVYKSHPELTDDEFVKRNLKRWLEKNA